MGEVSQYFMEKTSRKEDACCARDVRKGGGGSGIFTRDDDDLALGARRAGTGGDSLDGRQARGRRLELLADGLDAAPGLLVGHDGGSLRRRPLTTRCTLKDGAAAAVTRCSCTSGMQRGEETRWAAHACLQIRRTDRQTDRQTRTRGFRE